MADEGRLATKVTSDLEVLHSKGPLITPGTSVLFKVRLLLGTDFYSLTVERHVEDSRETVIFKEYYV